MKNILKATGVVVAVSGLILSITACTQQVALDRDTTQSSSSGSSSSAPQFTGPFSSLLTQIWDESESDFVREVIADGSISDQEWAETGDRLEQCLTGKNIEFLGFKDDGSYGYNAGNRTLEEIEPILEECEASSGESWINMLRIAAKTNPGNEPPEVVVRECMIRLGVVDNSYSSEDFLRDVETLEFPLSPSGPGLDGFWACNADPSTKTFSPSD